MDKDLCTEIENKRKDLKPEALNPRHIGPLKP